MSDKKYLTDRLDGTTYKDYLWQLIDDGHKTLFKEAFRELESSAALEFYVLMRKTMSEADFECRFARELVLERME